MAMNPRKRYPSGKPMSEFAQRVAASDAKNKSARSPRNKALGKIGERSVLTKGAAKTAAKTVAKRLGAVGAVYTAADIGAGIYDRQVAVNRESAAKRLRDEATALDRQMATLRGDLPKVEGTKTFTPKKTRGQGTTKPKATTTTTTTTPSKNVSGGTRGQKNVTKPTAKVTKPTAKVTKPTTKTTKPKGAKPKGLTVAQRNRLRGDRRFRG
jgi:hypothetical protein